MWIHWCAVTIWIFRYVDTLVCCSHCVLAACGDTGVLYSLVLLLVLILTVKSKVLCRVRLAESWEHHLRGTFTCH